MKTKNIGLAILGTLLVVLLVTSLAKTYVANDGQSGFLASVVNLSGGSSAKESDTGPKNVHPNRILVKFKPGAASEKRQSATRDVGANEVGEISQINVKILSVPENSRSRALEALKRNPNVEFAEEDAIGFGTLIPNDPSFGNQYWPAMHNLPEAWDTTTGSPFIIIAVIDSGIDFNHPEFSGRLVQGKDFVNNDNDPSDDHGHGTAVSGVIAATGNNSIGIAGSSWQTKIMPLKGLGSGGWGYYSWWANAITYASDNGAKVINMSLGGTSYSSTLQNAVNYALGKGVVVVAAAGNSGSSAPNYPAALDNVISVSALSQGDSYAGWSSYGSSIDISAAGESVLTTHLGSSYASWSGTSFSSPLVAGIIALMRSANPSLSAQTITSLLFNSAIDLGSSGWDERYGWGKADAARAVQMAVSEQTISDTTPPTALVTTPSNGSNVSGVVSIGYSASDNVGVSRTSVLVDGQTISEQSSSSGSVQWNSASVADGTHSITVRAWDLVGNTAVSPAVSVSVKNTLATPDTTPPVVSIVSPPYGSTVPRSAKITVSATDNVGVVLIKLFANGVLIGSSNSSSATFTWNTRKISKGSHKLVATAQDAAGNIGTSLEVMVIK